MSDTVRPRYRVLLLNDEQTPMEFVACGWSPGRSLGNEGPPGAGQSYPPGRGPSSG
jgi:hypothetical protein